MATNAPTASPSIPPARSVMPPPSPIPAASPIPPASPVPEPSARTEAQLPFSGYDRLNAKQVKDGLSDHSQVELQAVESYERSHQGREAVLDKLRYLRGLEPLPGYDALGVEEILAALKDADLATLKRVRGYERKFANRPPILDDVARVHGERRAAEPARAAPAYEPTAYEPKSGRALVGK